VIEAAYKALMKKHHPDLHPAGLMVGERTAAELNRAWHVLRDPERRAAYDAEEKAREERRKVDLARAFPDQGADVPRRPSPPPSGRAGHRVAAGIGLVGIAVLIGALATLAREPDPVDARLVTTTPPLVTDMAGARMPGLPPGIDEEAFRVLPVNRQQVFTAVAEFKRISGIGGLPAAARVSERCFASQSRSRGIGEFDYCVAFDHAASRRDLTPSVPSEPHFDAPKLVQRHVRAAADSLSKDTTIIEARLFEIRRLADSALLDLSEARPVQAVQVQQPLAGPIAAPPAPRMAQERPRPAPRKPAPPRQERPQDFVERQGGIY
jgi:curved DNA-binding protein CbpA